LIYQYSKHLKILISHYFATEYGLVEKIQCFVFI